MALDMKESAVSLAEEPFVGERRISRTISDQERLVVALDTRTAAEARKLVEQLNSTGCVYKIGLELIFGGGLALARELKEQNKQVFLDMKLHDIGNTVEKAVANIASQGFDFLTVHGLNRKILKSAVNGKNRSNLKLLAVTVLTDLTKRELIEEGLSETALDLAVQRAVMAQECGFDGVIASGHEANAIRQATRTDFIIKVPGIRPRGSDVGDQVRVMTPTQAIQAGATYLVVGRPIIASPDPYTAAISIQNEIAQARRSM